MKRCPSCSRVYDDDALRFCLDDGTNLVDRPSGDQSSGDQPSGVPAPATLVLPSSPEPVATMKQEVPPAVPAPLPNAEYQAPAVVPKKRNVLLWIVGAVLLVTVGGGFVVGALVIYKKRTPLKWHLVLRVESDEMGPDAAAKQSAAVIEKRLDAFGISHYRVMPNSDGQITVDLPAVENPERVKLLISTGGRLELAHVVSAPNPSPPQTYATIDQALASYASVNSVTPNRRIAVYDDDDEPSKEKYVVLETPSIVDGSELRDASAARSSYDQFYQVNFTLNRTGAEKFGTWTASHINEYLAVVLNEDVKSIAYIKSMISDQGQISGRFTKESAEDLALVLKAGALPGKMRFLEERFDN